VPVYFVVAFVSVCVRVEVLVLNCLFVSVRIWFWVLVMCLLMFVVFRCI